MRKAIGSKLYDTETAREIGYASRGEGPRDPYWTLETLYKKRTGEYFLHGQGGAMTKYARPAGPNAWEGGERISPLTVSMAKEWADGNLDAEECLREFGPIASDASRTVLSVSLPADTAARIRREAQEKGVSVSALIASRF